MLSGMDMEGIGIEEHVVGSCNNDATHIIKGKRTKRRLRPLSPCAVTATAVTSSCSSASAGDDYGSFSSTTYEGTDQEEEDMANCLILLAQGGGGGGEGDPHPHHHHDHQQQQKQEAENHVEGGVGTKVTERATKSGFYIYECKTCNRTFPSFQALGGHRASHKKPKVMTMMMTTQEEKKSPPPPPPAPPLITTTCDEFEEAKQSSHSHMKISPNPNPNPPPVSLELGCGVNRGASFNKCSSKSSKIHECSICGAEFTSGQALGGHMRRHRASTTNTNTPPTIQTTFDAVVVDVNNKPRKVLELDLNLPAPEDDLRDSKFQFPTTQKSSMVLSPAPALVGCHY